MEPSGIGSSEALVEVTAVTVPRFEEFFVAEHVRLARALYLLTGSAAEADELTQEAMVRVYERWDRVQQMDSAPAEIGSLAASCHFAHKCDLTWSPDGSRIAFKTETGVPVAGEGGGLRGGQGLRLDVEAAPAAGMGKASRPLQVRGPFGVERSVSVGLLRKEERMRKIVLVGICSVVLVTVPLGVGAWASPHDDVFQGSWTSIDSDGSNLTLDIRGSGQSGHRAMVLFDDATSGACYPSPARVQGSGVVDGYSLLMTGTLTCLPGGNPVTGRISLGFVYDPGTDTLTDDSGITWYRA